MNNPLLEDLLLPAFSAIKPEHVQPAVETLLQQNRDRLAALLAELKGAAADGEWETAPSWSNLAAPIEQWDDELSKAWSPVGHMNSVVNSDELRDAYNACLPLLSEYWTEIGQNTQLCDAYKALQASPEFAQLSQAQKKTIENELRSFRLAGVDLPADKKQRFGEISKRLSELNSKFSENVLDATQAWSKTITEETELAGLPDSAKALLAQQAQQKEQDGWVVTLDFPSYYPILSYADNRTLREEVYTAYVTRASEQGPNAGQFDNSALMQEILELRYEKAQLLGFESYSELSVATKMADSPQQVLDFLDDLAVKSKPQAEREIAELKQFAKDNFGAEDLKPWDVSYYAEKLRQQKYDFSQEEVRPYFPVDNAIQGMFTCISRLFGVEFVEQTDVDLYHPDARFFEIHKNGEQLASFYFDLYARPKKRGGAWMDVCRSRRQTDSGIQLPVAYMVCNFTPPVGDEPALMTHDELTTLFHEFGHGLHHMLTRMDVAAVSGIAGVEWDAVELPSQFLENWCYEPEALAFISGHYETGEPLPQALLDKLLAAKNFQSAMGTIRQLEFALFDFRLHHEFREQGADIQGTLNQVREQITVVPTVDFSRFQHSFSHIFAGGYAAGYYSYKWAEVLSADAFSRFEEEGIFNQTTGQQFLDQILTQGGSQDAAVLFKNFRGREPSADALLRHCGIDIPTTETEGASA